MEDTEQKALLGKESELPSPPEYQQLEPEVHASPPNYAMAAKPIALPTYDQSEKYEKEGVLQVSSPHPDHENASTGYRWTSNTERGTACEFMLFFTICATFSVVGFIFSFCLATTTAAQSGAIAGLGTAFVTKPLIYEFYYKNYESNWSRNWCSASYTEKEALENCLHRTETSMRILLCIVGLFGIMLLYKGFSGFFQSRGSSNN